MKKEPSIYIRPYSKKKKKKRIKRILLVVISLLVFFALTIYLFLHWLIKKESKELEKLKLDNQMLRSEIKKYQSSEQAYEELLRTKLGFIKDGEKIIIYSESKRK